MSQLFSAKDSQAAKLIALQKKMDTLPHPLPPTSQSETTPQKSHTAKPKPTLKSPSPEPSIATDNRFSILSNLNENDQPIDSETYTSPNQANIIDSKRSPPSRLTPLEKLKSLHLRSDTNTLLVGDSQLTRIDPARMSVDGAVVQTLAVPGLTVSDVTTWLSDLSPSPHIQRVTCHVGVNSCKEGPVSQQIWKKLFQKLQDCFPNSTLYASSIIIAGARHQLSQAVFVSNDNMRTVCQQHKVCYIDNTPAFLTANMAPRKALFMPDRIHLSPAGTVRLACNIRFAEIHPSPHQDDDRDEEMHRRYPSHQYGQQQQRLLQQQHRRDQLPLHHRRHQHHTKTLNGGYRGPSWGLHGSPHVSQHPTPIHQSAHNPSSFPLDYHGPYNPATFGAIPNPGSSVSHAGPTHQAGPFTMREQDFPPMPSTAEDNRAVNSPLTALASNPMRRWEARDNQPEAAEALRVLAQIMKPYLQQFN